MTANQQSEVRWGGLVFLGMYLMGKPVYTVLTKTQIVEIIEPRTIEWIDPQGGCVRGVCDYEQETIPVVDLRAYCQDTSKVVQGNSSMKQLIVLRTSRIYNSRAQKLGLCSLKSVQTVRLTAEQQKKAVDDRSNISALLANTSIVRGFFTLPKIHIALFNFDRIAEEAKTVIMK